MRDFCIGTAVVLILTMLFSAGIFPAGGVLPLGNIGTEWPGDSGMVLPVGGDAMVEVKPKAEELRQEGSEESDPPAAETKIQAEREKEERSEMADVMIAFWHGVATVLIGESVALLVAVAWMKIRRSYGDT